MNPRIKKSKIVVLILLLVIIIMCSATPARAQDNKCFDQGSQLIQLGIGFGGTGYYNYNTGNGYSHHRIPALSLSYEQALSEKAGPGLIGIGGYIGYAGETYKYNNAWYHDNSNHEYYNKHRWNYFMLAARGTYHADALTWEKGEVYFGTMLGVRIQTYHFETNNPDPFYNGELNDGNVYLTWSIFGGARYYVTPKIGAFAELGYGISYLTLGVTFKL